MTLEEELKSKLTSIRKENKQLKEDLDKSEFARKDQNEVSTERLEDYANRNTVMRGWFIKNDKKHILTELEKEAYEIKRKVVAK
tara:strand:+ start:7681 stop:7932 length:252 start_codon:yes stop_codon:yes gene_type:complete